MRPRTHRAFEEVFRAEYPDVLRYLQRRLPTDVAEDVAAEVFAVAWDQWATVPAAIRPWLFGVARHLLVDDHRAAGRRRRLELRMGAAGVADLADDPTDLADASLDLRLAWRRLPDTDREVLALVAWDGLTGREAAAVLGCTRAAFSVRLTRARRRLRALVEEVEPVEAARAATAFSSRPAVLPAGPAAATPAVPAVAQGELS